MVPRKLTRTLRMKVTCEMKIESLHSRPWSGSIRRKFARPHLIMTAGQLRREVVMEGRSLKSQYRVAIGGQIAEQSSAAWVWYA